MPLYRVACNKCHHEDDVFIKLHRLTETPICCHERMYIKIVPVNIQPDNVCYKSMVTGEMITGRRQHREHLKLHNCVEVGNEKPKPPKTITTRDREALKRDMAERLNT